MLTRRQLRLLTLTNNVEGGEALGTQEGGASQVNSRDGGVAPAAAGARPLPSAPQPRARGSHRGRTDGRRAVPPEVLAAATRTFLECRSTNLLQGPLVLHRKRSAFLTTTTTTTAGEGEQKHAVSLTNPSSGSNSERLVVRVIPPSRTSHKLAAAWKAVLKGLPSSASSTAGSSASSSAVQTVANQLERREAHAQHLERCGAKLAEELYGKVYVQAHEARLRLLFRHYGSGNQNGQATLHKGGPDDDDADDANPYHQEEMLYMQALQPEKSEKEANIIKVITEVDQELKRQFEGVYGTSFHPQGSHHSNNHNNSYPNKDDSSAATRQEPPQVEGEARKNEALPPPVLNETTQPESINREAVLLHVQQLIHEATALSTTVTPLMSAATNSGTSAEVSSAATGGSATLPHPNPLQQLMPFQREGVTWLLERIGKEKVSVILADDMGLGKTAQSIFFLHCYKKMVEELLPAHAYLDAQVQQEGSHHHHDEDSSPSRSVWLHVRDWLWCDRFADRSIVYHAKDSGSKSTAKNHKKETETETDTKDPHTGKQLRVSAYESSNRSSRRARGADDDPQNTLVVRRPRGRPPRNAVDTTPLPSATSPPSSFREAAETYRPLLPILIVAPLSTLPHWKAEFAHFGFTGKGAGQDDFDIYLINGSREEREQRVHAFVAKVEQQQQQRPQHKQHQATWPHERLATPVLIVPHDLLVRAPRKGKKTYFSPTSSHASGSRAFRGDDSDDDGNSDAEPDGGEAPGEKRRRRTRETRAGAKRGRKPKHERQLQPQTKLKKARTPLRGSIQGIISRLKYQIIILDEAQRIKNSGSTLFKKLGHIFSFAQIALTGTPLQNNIKELFSLLQFTAPKAFLTHTPGESNNNNNKNNKSNDHNNRSGSRSSNSSSSSAAAKTAATAALFEKLDGLLQEVSSSAALEDKELYILLCRRVHRLLHPFILRRTKALLFQKDDAEAAAASAAGGGGGRSGGHAASHHHHHHGTHSTNRSFFSATKKEFTIECPLLPYQERELQYIKKKADENTLSGNFTIQARKVLLHPYTRYPSFDIDEDMVRTSGRLLLLDFMMSFLVQASALPPSTPTHLKGPASTSPQPQQAQPHKFLVFCSWTLMLDVVESLCLYRHIPYVRLDGRTPVQEREASMHLFNTHHPQPLQQPVQPPQPAQQGAVTVPPICFLVSKGAGGVGLNLQAADTVFLLDLEYNPQRDQQALSRVYRVGQTRQVRVYRFFTKVPSTFNHADDEENDDGENEENNANNAAKEKANNNNHHKKKREREVNVEEHVWQHFYTKKEKLDQAIVQAGLYSPQGSALEREAMLQAAIYSTGAPPRQRSHAAAKDEEEAKVEEIKQEALNVGEEEAEAHKKRISFADEDTSAPPPPPPPLSPQQAASSVTPTEGEQQQPRKRCRITFADTEEGDEEGADKKERKGEEGQGGGHGTTSPPPLLSPPLEKNVASPIIPPHDHHKGPASSPAPTSYPKVRPNYNPTDSPTEDTDALLTDINTAAYIVERAALLREALPRSPAEEQLLARMLQEKEAEAARWERGGGRRRRGL